MISQRRTLANHIITNLKEIDGGVSPYDSSYTFITNLSNNVSRGFKPLETINDFPTITVEAGPERYSYHTAGNTEGYLELLLRGYLRNGDASLLKAAVDDLIQDVDHVIYKMSTEPGNLHTIRVGSVDSDGGLLEDYAIVEIRLILKYELGFI